MKVVIIDDEPLISDKLKRIMETGLRGYAYGLCFYRCTDSIGLYLNRKNLGLF